MNRTWQISELFQEGKHIDQSLCEDRYVVTERLVAVIDGATDKSGLKYELDGSTVSGGLFASTILSKALNLIPIQFSPRESIAFLSGYLESKILEQYGDILVEDRPSAALIVFDREKEVVYWVGDCQLAIMDWNRLFTVFQNELEIDRILGSMRSLTHLALKAKGEPWDPDSNTPDPGRQVIMPFLRIQGILANSLGEYGYGIVNGKPIPDRYIGVYNLQEHDLELVLASDGYPELIVESADGSRNLTLESTEKRLAELLILDPLCVKELKGNKGLQYGQKSFDDRTWVKLTAN